MSLSVEVLNQIKQDYQGGVDNQTLVFNDEAEKSRFWAWFQNEAEQYTISNSPNTTLIGDHNIGGRCFGNSQTISCNNELDYYEGFLLANNDSYFHGFNLNIEGLVEDYTALSNPEAFNDTTVEYYGVKIDKDFIYENNLEVLVEGAMNIPHLLLEHFRYHTNNR